MIEKLIERNYTKGRGGKKVKYVVVHTYGGGGKSLYNWFNRINAQYPVSAHYAVFLDGGAERYVREVNTAWHAGVMAVNQESIGIEHQDNGNPSDSARTNEMYETSAQLIADIFKRHNLPLDMSLIKPHNAFVKKQCPGGLDLNRIRNRVAQILQNQNMAETGNKIPAQGMLKTLGKVQLINDAGDRIQAYTQDPKGEEIIFDAFRTSKYHEVEYHAADTTTGSVWIWHNDTQGKILWGAVEPAKVIAAQEKQMADAVNVLTKKYGK